jgi:Ni/Fe-hydrogenase 1 B-type cytochrome subunit
MLHAQPAVQTPLTDSHHPERVIGPTAALYVWQYPMRLFHWGMVISLAVLSFTGYYIHNPFIVGQVNPFLMGEFRFVHEVFGMILIALFILRVYLYFTGNRWVRWRQYVPLTKAQFQEMVNVAKFYMFINPEPVSKIGHNAMAACSYIGLMFLLFVEIVTGLVFFNVLRHSPILTFFVGWIPHFISLPTMRLIHFLLMYVFIAFGVFHVHLCMLISREEKRGLMDSIFIGYKVIPEDEIQVEELKEIEGK